MEEASKRFLSTEDRFKSLLLRYNNDLVKLLLQAVRDDHLLSECLSDELEKTWELYWLNESKSPKFVALIPFTCKPSFFGAAISILNNRNQKAAVIQYLEIFSAAPHFNFHAQKVMTKLLIKSIESEKENSASEDQLFLQAKVHAENAAKIHHSPGYFLLATLHYRMAQRRKDLALNHYEVAYRNILIGEKLAEHSTDPIQVDHSELTLVEEMTRFLKTTIFTLQRVFEKVRAESAAAKEATEIIATFYSADDPTDNPTWLTF